MDKFVKVMGQIEVGSSRTDNLRGTEIFHILENFISVTLTLGVPVLTRKQLKSFIVALKNYSTMTLDRSLFLEEDEISHLHRRNVFLSRLEKEEWLTKLETMMEKMDY